MMTGAKPQLAGIISPQFSGAPSSGRGGRGGLGSAPPCHILHYFLLHLFFSHTIKGMSPNLGQIERRSVSPIVVSPFQDGARIPVVHMEICGNVWMRANSLKPGTELQPHVKHPQRMPSVRTYGSLNESTSSRCFHRAAVSECLLLVNN